jgi:hypothetical protein
MVTVSPMTSATKPLALPASSAVFEKVKIDGSKVISRGPKQARPLAEAFISTTIRNSTALATAVLLVSKTKELPSASATAGSDTRMARMIRKPHNLRNKVFRMFRNLRQS